MKKFLISSIVLLLSQTMFAQAGKNKHTVIVADRVRFDVPVSFKEPRRVLNDSFHYLLLGNTESVVLNYQLPSPANQAAVEVSDNDITQWTDKQLSALRKSAKITFIDDGIFLQDGKNIGYIKYTTDQENSWDTYHMLFFMSVDGKLFQANFMSPYRNRKKWEPVADEIANSLRLIPAE